MIFHFDKLPHEASLLMNQFTIKSAASRSQGFHTGLKKCIKEKLLRCFMPCSIKSELSPKILDTALANDRLSFRESSINIVVNFHKYPD